MVHPPDLSSIEKSRSVGHAPHGCIVERIDHRADPVGEPHHRHHVAGDFRQPPEHVEVGPDESRADQQVFGWVSRDRQFGKQEHIGVLLFGPGHRLGDSIVIALEVPNYQVQLGSGHA